MNEPHYSLQLIGCLMSTMRAFHVHFGSLLFAFVSIVEYIWMFEFKSGLVFNIYHA